MKIYYYPVAVLMLTLFTSMSYANLILPEAGSETKVFMSQADTIGRNVILKGKVVSFATDLRVQPDDIIRKARQRSRVTVRLYDTKGVREGDILYIVNEQNIVRAQLEVGHIYKSRSFGYMLTGYGNFRLASMGDRVVQRMEDAISEMAFRYKSRGDYYQNKGEISAAISEYKKAIEYDSGYPEARQALGDIYFEDNLYQLSINEYLKAYENIDRLYDREDSYMLLKRMAEVRLIEIEMPEIYRHMTRDQRIHLISKYREEAKRYCREALTINPGSADIHYYLGRLYYVKSDAPHDSDSEARDHFLNALKYRPDHSEANMYLSILYYRNNNVDRAREFIEKAVESDPSNQRAHDIRRKIR